jgi:hypothetical protein
VSSDFTSCEFMNIFRGEIYGNCVSSFLASLEGNEKLCHSVNFLSLPARPLTVTFVVAAAVLKGGAKCCDIRRVNGCNSVCVCVMEF